MFVGNTVSGEESDILGGEFLADFLNSDAQIKTWLADLIADKAQILDAKGNNIFSGRFTPLMSFSGRVDDLYADILLRVFNASARQRLKLVNIKSSKGELALRGAMQSPSASSTSATMRASSGWRRAWRLSIANATTSAARCSAR